MNAQSPHICSRNHKPQRTHHLFRKPQAEVAAGNQCPIPASQLSPEAPRPRAPRPHVSHTSTGGVDAVAEPLTWAAAATGSSLWSLEETRVFTRRPGKGSLAWKTRDLHVVRQLHMYAVYTTDTIATSLTVVAAQIFFCLLPLRYQGFSSLVLLLLICYPFSHAPHTKALATVPLSQRSPDTHSDTVTSARQQHRLRPQNHFGCQRPPGLLSPAIT